MKDRKSAPNFVKSTKSISDTIWYDDFSNSANWTFTNDGLAGQDWQITTFGPVGFYSAPLGTIVSSSGGNFALYDSDGIGATGQVSGDQNASVETVSPIDLSGYQSVAIRFEQLYRRFHNDTYIGVSTDGTTWTDLEVNAGVEVGNYGNHNVELNITSLAANQPQVWIRFKYFGEWDYAWMVDDVAIIDAPANELVLEKIWIDFDGTGFYSMIPDSQSNHQDFIVDTIRYVVFNNGGLTQTNISLTMDVNSGLYSFTSPIVDSLISGARDTFQFIIDFIPQGVDVYSATFLITQDSTDEVPDNNFQIIDMEITNYEYARDLNYSYDSGPKRYLDGIDGDAIGTQFWVYNSQEVNSISVYIAENSDPGTTIRGLVLEFTSAGFNEILTTQEHSIEPGEPGTWLNLPIEKDGASEFIDSANMYIAAIECYWGNDSLYIGADNISPTWWLAGRLRLGGAGNDDWSWANEVPMIRLNFEGFVFPQILEIVNNAPNSIVVDSLYTYTPEAIGGTGNYTFTCPTKPAWLNWDGTTLSGTPTVADIGNGDVEIEVSDGVISDTYSYTISIISSVQEIENLIAVYPNPVKEIINIRNADNSNIRIFNIEGREILNIENARNTLSIDVSYLSEGLYFMKITKNHQIFTKTINIYK
jgi:hypothetical protein